MVITFLVTQINAYASIIMVIQEKYFNIFILQMINQTILVKCDVQETENINYSDTNKVNELTQDLKN